MFTAVVLLISLIAVPAVAAEQPTLPDRQVSLDCADRAYSVNYSVATDLYDSNTDAIPDAVKPFVQANTTEISIANASQQYYTVRTDPSMEVTQVELGEASDEDVAVTLNRSTACRLYTSNTPVSTFQTVYANDAVEIEPTGPIKSAATTVVDAVTDFIW